MIKDDWDECAGSKGHFHSTHKRDGSIDIGEEEFSGFYQSRTARQALADHLKDPGHYSAISS